MAAVEQNLTVYANDSFTITFTVANAGVPVDISAATDVRWAFSVTDTSAALVTKTLGAGVTITNGPAGQFQVALVPADTEPYRGAHFHVARMTLGGVVTTVATGTLDIRPTPF
jgi:hypothetical protein